jgi:hypothetical protein
MCGEGKIGSSFVRNSMADIDRLARLHTEYAKEGGFTAVLGNGAGTKPSPWIPIQPIPVARSPVGDKVLLDRLSG